MRIVMNKKSLFPALRLFIPAAILLSFLISGCAKLPTETDDTLRTYKNNQPENTSVYKNQKDSGSMNAGKRRYSIGQHEEATAHYNYKAGSRPDSTGYKYGPASTPDMQSQLADLAMVIDADNILFEFDKWVIKQEFHPELDKWAAFFHKNPQVTAQINGHADSTGPESYNQSLSEKRAQAVINYLVGKGVAPERLTAVGFGETIPAQPNTTKEGRQKNRRVEFNIN